MHRYQVWVTCAMLLALAHLSGLHGRPVQSADNDNRDIYSEEFSALSNLDHLEDTYLDIENTQLTLQLDDHIAQQEPIVISSIENSTTYVYVVWHDLRNDSGDIYAQKLDADGMRVWKDDLKINNNSPDGTTQSAPAAAINDDGNLWVVWVDDRQGQNDLYAQYLTLQTEPVDESSLMDEDLPIPLSSDLIYQANQASPTVTTYGNDLIVAWHDNRNGVDFDIYAQRIGIDRQAQWNDNDRPIHTNATSSQSDPTIAIDEAGNVMVAWLDQRVGNGDIYYTRRSLPDANASWEVEKQANETGNGARKPPVLVMGPEEGVGQICWLSSTDTGYHIYLQTIEANSNQTSLANRKVTAAPVNPGMNPAIALLGSRIAIGWKAIGDGHLYVDIGDVTQLLGVPVPVPIDSDGADGNNNRSQNLSLVDLNDNELFAVWVDERGGRATDIYGKKLGANGIFAWSYARFINDSTGRIDQQNPAVAVDSNGNTIVAWYSERGGQSNLFLQKFDSKGVPAWKRQIPVSDVRIQGEPLKPDIAALKTDILVTWSDRRRSGTSQVYVQRFDSQGNRIWHDDQLATKVTDSTNGQFNPQIAVDTISSGGSPDIFIVWQESDGTTSRITLQKLDSEGTPILAEDQVVISSNTATLQFPALAVTSEQIIIAWTSTTLASTDLYLQARNKEDGTAEDGPEQVNEFSGLVDQLNPPALAANQNGNAVVVWTDRRESAIYARGVDSRLNSRWGPQNLNKIPGSFSPTPDIALLNTNDMIVVWQGLNQGQFFIYAQRLNDQGITQWGDDIQEGEKAIKVSGNNSQEAWLPAVAVDSSGMSSIVWREERNMNQDIYLSRLDEDGQHWDPDGRFGDDFGDVVVIDSENFYRSEGTVKSNLVDTTGQQIHKALLTYQGALNDGQITFKFLNGSSELSIQAGKIYTFTPPVTELRWQAHLSQTNVAALGQTPPVIDKIDIDYSYVTTATQPGDIYEPDDECGSAWPIQSDGIVQERTLHNIGSGTDIDWIFFRTAPDTEYILMATPEHDDGAKLQVDVYSNCLENALPRIGGTGTQDNPAHLFLSSLGTSTRYTVTVSSESTTKETIPYELSIRPVPSNDQAVVVRGFHDDPELFQVDWSATRVSGVIKENGVTPHELNYATHPDIKQELEKIAQQEILADTTLIVYLVGQVDEAGFKLSNNESLTPNDLDLWLSNLENTGKIRNATVVIEADNAGRFIETLSLPGRVIVTSTSAGGRTERTTRGFLFSDAFWLSMGQGYSVQQSFNIGNQIVEEVGTLCSASNCLQDPQLIDSSSLAQSSGLRVAAIQKVPVVGDLSVTQMQADSLKITTSISSDISPDTSSSRYVEARIRPVSGDTDDITGSPVVLELNGSSTEQYTGELKPVPAYGRYYITIYSWDDSFVLLPKISEYDFYLTTYFPVISK